MNTKEMVEKNLIYKCIHGSTAYGLNTPTSDIDTKGVFIPSIDFYFGMREIEQQEYGADSVIYAIKKFFTLARDCNPNIIEVLFCDESDILFIDDYGKLLRKHRDSFLSKKAKFTFSGYAFSQLQRIKGHRRWIMNPQVAPLEQDFYVTKYRIVDGVSTPYQAFREHEYDLALKKFNQYQEWVKNRHEDRAKLEQQFGYDTKHAMHLIRLLRMGQEILRGEGVIVKRPDRKELLEIRNGEWTYERVIHEAESSDKILNELYDNSKLRHSPDDEFLNDLLIHINEEFYERRENS